MNYNMHHYYNWLFIYDFCVIYIGETEVTVYSYTTALEEVFGTQQSSQISSELTLKI